MDDELDFFLRVLDGANLELDEVYFAREVARVTLGPERDEHIASFEGLIDAYIAKIDAMRTSIAHRMLLQRNDLSEAQRAFVSGLIDSERKDLWSSNKREATPL